LTPEQRLNRLERIVKLFVKAGLRAREQGREQTERIQMLIDRQIRNDDKFAAHEEKFGDHDEKVSFLLSQQIRTDEKFGDLIEIQKRNEERFVLLADSQADSEKRLTSLIETIRTANNGNPLSES